MMRLVLGSRRARPRTWELDQLPYLSVLPGRALARLVGTAELETGEGVRWSAVVKVITPPPNAKASSVPDNGHREVLAYRSGLLTELPGLFRAPHLYTVNSCRRWADLALAGGPGAARAQGL